MIKSHLGLITLKLYQASTHFSGWFKGHVCGQESGVGDSLGNEAIFALYWHSTIKQNNEM